MSLCKNISPSRAAQLSKASRARFYTSSIPNTRTPLIPISQSRPNAVHSTASSGLRTFSATSAHSPLMFGRRRSGTFLKTDGPDGTDFALPKWRPPTEESLKTRPVLIVGAGYIGCRVAVAWASAGRPVTLYDKSEEVLRAAMIYIRSAAKVGQYPCQHVSTTTSLREATATRVIEDIKALKSGSKKPWMAIECLPGALEVKVALLSNIEHMLPDDYILASSSSSFPTRRMIHDLRHPERLLNTLYLEHPEPQNAPSTVQLMSSTRTDEAIFPFLIGQFERIGVSARVVPPACRNSSVSGSYQTW